MGRGATLGIAENDLRSGFVDLKLGAYLLNLRCLLFETRNDSFHSHLIAIQFHAEPGTITSEISSRKQPHVG